VRWRARTIVQRHAAQRASRPQLKRNLLDATPTDRTDSLLLALAALSVAVLACGRPANEHRDIPDAAVFNETLQRDLDSYFGKAESAPVKVTFELLRDQPTITGIAYPKYYVWVEVRSNEGLRRVGAARVAAINGSFEVTNFVAAETINLDPGSLLRW